MERVNWIIERTVCRLEYLMAGSPEQNYRFRSAQAIRGDGYTKAIPGLGIRLAGVFDLQSDTIDVRQRDRIRY